MALFKKKQPQSDIAGTAQANEQAVIISYDLTSEYGTQDEQMDARRLADELERVVSSGELGEYDGDEFGGGEATIYLYGLDAKNLYEAVKPLLSDFDHKPIRVTLQYGPPGNINTTHDSLTIE